MPDDLLDRIDNWRRFYRQTQKITAVPYYSPPDAGETMQDDRVVHMPVLMQDAVLLELTWRNLDNPAKKIYIKMQYIVRCPHQVIWRKVRHYGDRINSHIDHQIYDRAALEYFQARLS